MLVKAILGPTNTGKTHLAIERMCAHSSGMIGFPLRLLAREVYDRVVAIKGERQVALITGEEKILPPDARYFLCTAESMPTDRDVAFVAVDEAQIGADPERGHVFTDRMLGARGREETLILGSEALRPMVRALLPKAEIVTRPRFSTLSYGGATKLSRLPPRSAVVAFSAEEVYAVAEMLRRFRGGAAVVMGALSPRTRNAQVAMYQAGEVDYIVATDAIGMGLNMDVHHVAFASLGKFDGRRQRRLTVPEMAQIAGRAGRHQRDGTFGTLHLGGGKSSPEFTPEEIEAIEEHQFPPLDHLYWRNSSPDFSSIDALVASLEARPRVHGLRPAPEAVDLAVLKAVADDGEVRARARHPSAVKKLWAVCGLPDFRKSGPVHHAQLVRRLFGHMTEGPTSENRGHVPHGWFADQVQRLDNVAGDIETIADRIAGVRTWAYIAHRPAWLAEPEAWAERTRAVEQRLSDALHTALTQRFVSRRTAVLLRDLGAKGADTLPMAIAEDGEVTVGDEPIGRLDGFTFAVDPNARNSDRRMLLAAAERRLGAEFERRAAALAGDEDAAFAVDGDGAVSWRGHRVATLAPGRTLLTPTLKLVPALARLSRGGKAGVEARLRGWVDARVARVLGPLAAIERAARGGGHAAAGARAAGDDRGPRRRRPARGGGGRAGDLRPRHAAGGDAAGHPHRRAGPVRARDAEARGAALARAAGRHRRIGRTERRRYRGGGGRRRAGAAGAARLPRPWRTDAAGRHGGTARHACAPRDGRRSGRPRAGDLARPVGGGGGPVDGRCRLPLRRGRTLAIPRAPRTRRRVQAGPARQRVRGAGRASPPCLRPPARWGTDCASTSSCGSCGWPRRAPPRRRWPPPGTCASTAGGWSARMPAFA
jgi:ATP-dependent RNA helicase SUPV3L1/SUV3